MQPALSSPRTLKVPEAFRRRAPTAGPRRPPACTDSRGAAPADQAHRATRPAPDDPASQALARRQRAAARGPRDAPRRCTAAGALTLPHAAPPAAARAAQGPKAALCSPPVLPCSVRIPPTLTPPARAGVEGYPLVSPSLSLPPPAGRLASPRTPTAPRVLSPRTASSAPAPALPGRGAFVAPPPRVGRPPRTTPHPTAPPSDRPPTCAPVTTRRSGL